MGSRRHHGMYARASPLSVLATVFAITGTCFNSLARPWQVLPWYPYKRMLCLSTLSRVFVLSAGLLQVPCRLGPSTDCRQLHRLEYSLSPAAFLTSLFHVSLGAADLV